MQKKIESLERDKKSMESQNQRYREELRNWNHLLNSIKKQDSSGTFHESVQI